MNITLDSATEQRIQREIDRGHYREPAEVIASAMALLEAQEMWSAEEPQSIRDHIEESFAAAERGELYTPDQVRAMLESDRLSR